MLIRCLAPPPVTDAATLARMAARLQTAIERRPRRRPQAAILLIAAALVLVLSVATAALRRVTWTPAVHLGAQEAPKKAIDDHLTSPPPDVPAVPALGSEDVERAAPIPVQNGPGSHRTHPEESIRRSSTEPASDGPEVAEALWLGRALRKVRVDHDPNGALGLLDGYEAQ